jgi:hypothetical protein
MATNSDSMTIPRNGAAKADTKLYENNFKLPTHWTYERLYRGFDIDLTTVTSIDNMIWDELNDKAVWQTRHKATKNLMAIDPIYKKIHRIRRLLQTFSFLRISIKSLVYCYMQPTLTCPDGSINSFLGPRQQKTPFRLPRPCPHPKCYLRRKSP